MLIASTFKTEWLITAFRPTPDSKDIYFHRERKEQPLAYRVLTQKDKVAVNRKVLHYGHANYKETSNPLETKRVCEDRLTDEVDKLEEYPNKVIVSRNQVNEGQNAEEFFNRYIQYNGKFYEKI